MVTESELLAAVDVAFEVTGAGLVSWPDPHPDRSPLDEEYSRVTNPARWRIVGARADAWLTALVDTGLASVERDTAIDWSAPPGTVVSRTDRAAPHRAGAVPLVVARSRIGQADDAGVTLGAGRPAVCVSWIPDCGCDACDSGARFELDRLDGCVMSIVSGRFRRLTNRDQVISVLGSGWADSSSLSPDDLTATLADPTGWDETSGSSWLEVD